LQVLDNSPGLGDSQEFFFKKSFMFFFFFCFVISYGLLSVELILGCLIIQIGLDLYFFFCVSLFIIVTFLYIF
jgi:hypothetical protein